MTTVPMPGHPTPLEVAEHLVDRLRLARGVTKLTHGPGEDGEAFLTGESSRGPFYLHLWPDAGGQLTGVQALAARPGDAKHLHLGYWRAPAGGLKNDAGAAARKVWAGLAEQDRENAEREMHSWVPVTRLPRVKTPPPAPQPQQEPKPEPAGGSVMDLFGT
jgi:hypothetical protein